MILKKQADDLSSGNEHVKCINTIKKFDKIKWNTKTDIRSWKHLAIRVQGDRPELSTGFQITEVFKLSQRSLGAITLKQVKYEK